MTALVLCGGGSRGAVEVGLYRALVELEIPIDLVVGTSVGAINGAAIAAGVPPTPWQGCGKTSGGGTCSGSTGSSSGSSYGRTAFMTTARFEGFSSGISP